MEREEPQTPRRRLDTAIYVLKGYCDAKQRGLIRVSCVPTGIRPKAGNRVEERVEIRFNAVAEFKVFENSIPRSTFAMIVFGIGCMTWTAIVVVPALARVFTIADEMVANFAAALERQHRRRQ